MIAMDNGNQDLKEYFKKKHIFQWKVAKMFGYSESAFIRRMREEFPDDIKEQIKQCVDDYLNDKTPDVTFFHDYIESISNKPKSKFKYTYEQKSETKGNRYANRIISDVLYYEELAKIDQL